jgi:mRNA interferase MazF
MQKQTLQDITNNFLEWIKVKINLNNRINNPPSFLEREIWWCNLGQNIGSEIYGKGYNFTRPVIVYKKLSRFTLLVIPCSTKIREGNWYVKFVHNSIDMVAVLSQIRIIDYRRLINKMGRIDTKDFEKIKLGFLDLYQ